MIISILLIFSSHFPSQPSALMEQFYFTVFTKDFPARSCVQVAKLPMNAKVEIEVIALTGDVETVSI